MALFYSRFTNDSQDPEGNSLFELQTFLGKLSKTQLPQYGNDNTHDFRMLEPKRGPIERSVKVFMPLNRLGRWVVVSYRNLLYLYTL